MENYDWDLLSRFIESMDDKGQMTFDMVGIEQTQKQLSILVEIGQIMAQKYHVVVTNPPYLGNKSMDTKVTNYLQKDGFL